MKFELYYNIGAHKTGAMPWTVKGETDTLAQADEVILEGVNGKTVINPVDGVHPKAVVEVYGNIEWVGTKAIIKGSQ